MLRDLRSKTHLLWPWAYSKKVFNSDECRAIERLGYSLIPQRATTRGQQIENYRNSNVSWIKPSDETSWIFTQLDIHLEYLNSTFYHFDLWGFSDLQFTQYDCADNGKYDAHIDLEFGENSQHTHGIRKLSCSVLLNNNFDGGTLELSNNGSRWSSVPMEEGDMVVFPSFELHRVTEVTAGRRLSLVTWIQGPMFR